MEYRYIVGMHPGGPAFHGIRQHAKTAPNNPAAAGLEPVNAINSQDW